jgi:hypothetical protein
MKMRRMPGGTTQHKRREEKKREEKGREDKIR